MSDVHADPEKLRQFAKQLERAADQLVDVPRELSRALDRSGWEDAERLKFEQDFKLALKSLSQFTDKLRNEYAPALQRRASILDQYRS